MSDNHSPASEGLSALTHTELLEFEQMLHEECEATYHEAQEAIAATGKVSAALAERLVQIQTMHVEIVQGLAISAVRGGRDD